MERMTKGNGDGSIVGRANGKLRTLHEQKTMLHRCLQEAIEGGDERIIPILIRRLEKVQQEEDSLSSLGESFEETLPTEEA